MAKRITEKCGLKNFKLDLLPNGKRVKVEETSTSGKVSIELNELILKNTIDSSAVKNDSVISRFGIEETNAISLSPNYGFSSSSNQSDATNACFKVINKYTKDYFSFLPDELIISIFKFLPNYKILIPNCTLVCKRWWKLCYDSSFWKNVNLNGKNIRVSVLKKLLSTRLECLTLKRLRIFDTENCAFTIGKIKLSKIYHLDLISIFKTDILEGILLNCCNLKSLNISRSCINIDIVNGIAANVHLENLNMYKTKGLLGSHVERIFQSCTKIIKLDLQGITWKDNDLDIIASNIPKSIKSLLIDGIEDRHFQIIIAHCPNIIGLDIIGCNKLTSNAIDLIVRGLPKLQYLLLRSSDYILPEHLNAFEDGMNSLKYLGLGVSSYDEARSLLTQNGLLSNYKNIRHNIYNYE